MYLFIYFFLSTDLDYDSNTKLRELPLPFEIPLPMECTVAGTNARSYNQGQCSRKHCRTVTGECAQSWKCCYEVDQISLVKFACSDSDNFLQGSVIVMCRCQICDKLHARIRGQVLSSLDRKPVVLATIMIGSEIATFTDQGGRFFFELTTSNRKVTLLFQEARHQHLEMTLNIHPSLAHELTVILEYIQLVEPVDKIHQGFGVLLASNITEEDNGIKGLLKFPSVSLVNPESIEVYYGPGQVLHSLYTVANKPQFSMPAVQQMIYKDSQGAEFSIQAYVIGSLKVVDENGRPLALRSGTPLPLTLSLKFDTHVKSSSVLNLHLFAYSESKSHWLDHGRLQLMSIDPLEDEIGSWVRFQGKLRELNPYWAVGFPVRVTCYIKSRVFHNHHYQELVGLSANLEQSDDKLGRATFYHYSTKTSPGSGACLRGVCSIGGMVTISAESNAVINAIPPSIQNGIIMGNKDQIVFYTTQKSQIVYDGRTPFYTTEQACMQNLLRNSAYFRFLTNSSVPAPVKPSILTTFESSGSVNQKDGQKENYCFLKVAVYDCASFTDVKVLSYSTTSERQLLSMNFDIATSHATIDSCLTSQIAQLRASCVEFACGSDVHVTVQSRHGQTETKDCRYWSSSSNIPWNRPPSHNLTSFHFVDTGLHYSGGVFQSSSRDLARMRCNSGDNEEPGSMIDPYKGTAVTFTCQS